jgi:hypothetical protein
VVIACWQGLRCIERDSIIKQQEAVKCLMTLLLGSNDAKLDDSQGKLLKAIRAHYILGIDNDKPKRRVAHHWNGYEQRDSRARQRSTQPDN